MLGWVWTQVNRLTKGFVPPPSDENAGKGLNVLMVTAHPLGDASFSGALANAAQSGLEKAGHSVERINLYSAGPGRSRFQPCLTAAERETYMTIYPKPSQDVQEMVEQLQGADALVFVYPTWWFNVPAILKGFFDRTLLPGVAFKLPHLEPENKMNPSSTGLEPNLQNIKKIACVSTYGSTRLITFAAGDNGRNMITRGVLPLLSPTCTVLWMSLHDMDNQTESNRKAFLQQVETRFKKF